MASSFDHKRTWKDKISHFRITEGAPHVKIRHFPFNGIHKTVMIMGVDNLSGPVTKIGRADGQGISIQYRRYPHGGLPPVTLSIKSDPPTVHIRKGPQPFKGLVMLCNYKSKKSFFHGICVSVQPPALVFSDKQSVCVIQNKDVVS